MNSRVYIDGVRPATMPSHPQATAPAPVRRAYSKPRIEPPKASIWQKLQLSVLLLAGTMGGFFADNLAVGLVLLGAYAVAAFITKIASRTTFTLALVLLGAISVMLLFKPSAQLIRNFATYAFVLLMVGVITLGLEARLPKRMQRKYRR